MKRIALVLAVVLGSQGCASQRGRAWYATDGAIVASALIVVVAGMTAAALMYQHNQRDPNERIPPFPPPPELQPR